MQTLTITKFEHFSLGGVGGPLKLTFANHFIIYQNRLFRGRIVPGRLHSELYVWGVKSDFLKLTSVKSKKSGYFEQGLFDENIKVRIFWSPDFKQTTVLHQA